MSDKFECPYLLIITRPMDGEQWYGCDYSDYWKCKTHKAEREKGCPHGQHIKG